MTLIEPRPNNEPRDDGSQGSSPHQGDTSPEAPTSWRWLGDLVRPAIYEPSWLPWVRITVTLGVVAVIAAAAIVIALVLR